MTIRRIRPVTGTAPIEGEVRRLLRLALSGGSDDVEMGVGWIPVVDVYETGGDLIVEIEVPGLTTRDVVVALSASRIEVRGLKKEESLPSAPRYLRLEREYGSFQRSVALPCAVAPDTARAVLSNGVLTVTIRKLRGARERDFVVKIHKNET